MSSRRFRRTQFSQPKYATDYDDLDADLDSYSSTTSSKRSTRSRNENSKQDDIGENIDNNAVVGGTNAEEEIDEVEEVTRCICGNDDLYIPKNNHGDFDNVDPGFFIQCETCSVWQHGYCVGIKDEENSPEKYWCEQCKPQNHTLFIDKYGIRRSKYHPSNPHTNNNNSQKKNGKRKNGRFSTANAVSNKTDDDDLDEESLIDKKHKLSISSTGANTDPNNNNNHDDDDDENIEYDGDDDNHKRKNRKRSSYYNYEEMLKKALEESAKESGVVPEEINISSNEGHDRRELRHQVTRKTRTRTNNDNSQSDSLNNNNNNNNNNNSNSNNENNNSVDLNIDNSSNIHDDQSTKVKVEKPNDKRKIRDSKRNKSKRNNSGTSISNDEHEEDNEDKIDAFKTAKSSNPSAYNSTMNPSNSTSATYPSTKRTPKREKKEPKATGVVEDKPFRANIPSARISMNEMTRRIFSINDFVSNIQINLTNEEEFKNNLFKMDDLELTSEVIDLKSKLLGCYNQSVQSLDELTSLLNTWQDEYS